MPNYPFLTALNGTLTDPSATAGDMPENLRDAASVYSKAELTGAPLATSGVASLLGVNDAGGIIRAANVAKFFKYDACMYGANPSASASVNTIAIQSAIDAASADGAGVVRFSVKGIYNVGASALVGNVGYHISNGVTAQGPYSSHVVLLLRSDVSLELDGVTLHTPTLIGGLISLCATQRSGVYGGKLSGIWDWNLQNGAGAAGVFSYFTAGGSAYTTLNSDIMFEGMEVTGFPGYGFGLQMGYSKNFKVKDCWVHDVGADAVDWKMRPYSDGSRPIGNMVIGLLAERYGRSNLVAGSAGVDGRGPIKVIGCTMNETGWGSSNNVGIRLSAGLNINDEHRDPSFMAIATDFQIDGGYPKITGTVGVVLLDSGGMAADGYITNCDYGVNSGDSSSGFGSNETAKVSNVVVDSAKTRGFQAASRRVTFSNCAVIGQREEFSEDKDNLVAGQTVLVSPRVFDVSTVQVWKNNVKLTLTTDYAVTDDETITLVAAALITDTFFVISPTPTGISVEKDHCQLNGMRFTYVTTPKDVTAPYQDTLQELGTVTDAASFISENNTSTSVILQARGPQTDIEVEIRGKNASGVTLRSRDTRAFRAVSPVSAVNWPGVTSSASGSPVDFTANGTDTNVGIRILPKGNGAVISAAPLALKTYTVATLPSVATYVQCIIYVSDGASNKRLAVSDGTNWRWPDGAIVS